MGVYSCTGPIKEGGVAGYIAEWGGQMLGWGVHANSNTFAVLKNTNTQLRKIAFIVTPKTGSFLMVRTSDELEKCWKHLNSSITVRSIYLLGPVGEGKCHRIDDAHTFHTELLENTHQSLVLFKLPKCSYSTSDALEETLPKHSSQMPFCS